MAICHGYFPVNGLAIPVFICNHAFQIPALAEGYSGPVPDGNQAVGTESNRTRVKHRIQILSLAIGHTCLDGIDLRCIDFDFGLLCLCVRNQEINQSRGRDEDDISRQIQRIEQRSFLIGFTQHVTDEFFCSTLSRGRRKIYIDGDTCRQGKNHTQDQCCIEFFHCVFLGSKPCQTFYHIELIANPDGLTF